MKDWENYEHLSY